MTNATLLPLLLYIQKNNCIELGWKTRGEERMTVEVVWWSVWGMRSGWSGRNHHQYPVQASGKIPLDMQVCLQILAGFNLWSYFHTSAPHSIWEKPYLCSLIPVPSGSPASICSARSTAEIQPRATVSSTAWSVA